ncbi:hypothetical protein [Listeria monocytogenes]|uniref:hypothetical protein n=1 Tax=Listeria monocytogenes TaxID=1639 RepID=UPI000BDF5559|nr:hypothetical protein [Listeria monocytogenes]PCW41864.1 hypothetical protein A7N99_03890 [Listeria monocytogenes]
MKQELSKTTTTSNKIIIPLPLTDLNTYINKERGHRQAAAKVKKQMTYICACYVKRAMSHGVTFSTPCRIKFTWIIPNKKKDPDNLAFAKKFIFDGMMEAGFLENDNLNYIEGFSDYFIVDKDEESRVIVEVEYD